MRRLVTSILGLTVASTAALVPAAPSQAGLLGTVTGALAPRNEVVIDLKSDLYANTLGTALGTLGWGIHHREAGSRPLYVARPAGLLAAAQSTVLSVLAWVPGVRKAEEDILFMVDRRYGGEQAQLPVLQDDMTACSVANQSAMDAVRAPHTMPSPTGTGPIVAIVDGGFDLRHQYFQQVSLVPGFDVRDGDSNVTDPGNGLDDDGDGVVDGGLGHGNAVAAVISVVAPTARICPIRALDDEGCGTVADLAAGVYAALDRNASVINFSLGTDRSSGILDDALSTAYYRGVVVVAAAGNEGEAPLMYPASSGYTTAVVGVKNDRTKDPVSNYGTGAEIGAPSFAVVAPFPRTTNKYGTWYGTSFATPFIAGATVHAMQTRGLSAMSASHFVVNSTQPYSYLDPSTQGEMGTGVLDASR